MSQATDWSPNGPLQLIQQRAFLCSKIRSFFIEKKVLEVETPVLSSAANTDLQIEVFSSQSLINTRQTSFLRTSPEFFHKRLLASGSGDIFEIAKVFRLGESTALHNPEFTLLEWYRLSFELQQLMDEVVELIQMLRGCFALSPMPVSVISYQSLFKKMLNFDPFDITDNELNQIAIASGYHGPLLNRTEALDFMFGIQIEPLLSADIGYLIHEFPIEQAALAQAHPNHPDRCLRFEFLWGGIELANGYQELTDATEQRQRFELDNLNRKLNGKPELPIDDRLIEALNAGLPNCSGVALGLERLLMCLLGKDSIEDVMPFNAHNS